jgi:N utilization substance protein B
MKPVDQTAHIPELPEQDWHDLDPAAYNDLSVPDARSLIFHILYAAESHDYQSSIESIVDNLNRGYDLAITPECTVFTIARAVVDQRDQLDTLIKPLLHNWRFERVGVCTKLILRLALWELTNSDIAPSIIMNEAIELAKSFSEKDAYKFINGVLDEFARSRDLIN